VLYEKAREYIKNSREQNLRDKVVFDLYSGTGTIAQMMAPAAKKVIGIEIVEEAVCAAKENARLNGLSNCEFIAGDVLKAIDLVEDKPDLIVLDPPRDGINPRALEKILAFNVDEMVYISCKPTSLARDLETITKHGYRVVKACAVDEFPGTVHVETVCLLSRKVQ
jgi:tRNA/tmRNA/rRNA uracil-C5-methylase (TrmA/RlmC/RlmD family)